MKRLKDFVFISCDSEPNIGVISLNEVTVKNVAAAKEELTRKLKKVLEQYFDIPSSSTVTITDDNMNAIFNYGVGANINFEYKDEDGQERCIEVSVDKTYLLEE